MRLCDRRAAHARRSAAEGVLDTNVLVRHLTGDPPEMAKKNKRKLAIADALISLEAAGLIERRSERVLASEVARRLDQMVL